jgi:hypothetical protein
LSGNGKRSAILLRCKPERKHIKMQELQVEVTAAAGSARQREQGHCEVTLEYDFFARRASQFLRTLSTTSLVATARAWLESFGRYL